MTTDFQSATFSLQDLIGGLHKAFDGDYVNVEYIHQLMSSYKSNPVEWKRFAKFDRHRYTRNLVDEGNGKFNLMLLAWGEGHGSAIHDHTDSHCFMKMLAGSLTETQFKWPETEQNGGMEILGERDFKVNEVAYINDSMGLHRVENKSHADGAVSLHLYCPPFSHCQMFDQRTGRKSKTNVTFWSKYGSRTPALVRSDTVFCTTFGDPENN